LSTFLARKYAISKNDCTKNYIDEANPKHHPIEKRCLSISHSGVSITFLDLDIDEFLFKMIASNSINSVYNICEARN
jgi:hypothetical protein